MIYKLLLVIRRYELSDYTIFNISFVETRKFESVSGNFLILNKLQPYNYTSSSLLKSQNVTEELVLYLFLGVFVIFVVDSFARAGKYTR